MWLVTAPSEFASNANRLRSELGEKPKDRGAYIVEVHMPHVTGLAGAAVSFSDEMVLDHDHGKNIPVADVTLSTMTAGSDRVPTPRAADSPGG